MATRLSCQTVHRWAPCGRSCHRHLQTQQSTDRIGHPARRIHQLQLQARRPSQSDWRDEDYVELDDEPDWEDEGYKGKNGLQSVFSGLLPQAISLSDRISEFVFYLFPEGTSRTAVDTIVKAGLVLLVLGVVRSLLGFVTTIGGIVLAFFIARNFLSKNNDNQQQSSNRSTGQNQRADRRSPRGFLSSGRAEPSRDWSDVWVDRQSVRRSDKEPRR